MWFTGHASRPWAASTPPSTTATEPSGNASRTIFAMSFDECGASSEGFRITVLPAAMAPSVGSRPITYGAFQLGSTSATPLGS